MMMMVFILWFVLKYCHLLCGIYLVLGEQTILESFTTVNILIKVVMQYKLNKEGGTKLDVCIMYGSRTLMQYHKAF